MIYEVQYVRDMLHYGLGPWDGAFIRVNEGEAVDVDIHPTNDGNIVVLSYNKDKELVSMEFV